jgi:molybdate transport system substrate-binding protein
MRRVAAVLAATALIAATGCGAGETATGAEIPTVRVAAASDLQFALEEVAEALATADPPVNLSVTYGSSGTFYQQILNGAPFDVYLSADLTYPEGLVEAGLAEPGDLFGYAVGRLVLWAPHGSPADVSAGLAGLTDPAVRQVAIANPAHAPYGAAAVAAMQTAGVYDEVSGKLVFGENVSQAGEFAASGNAQVAIIALALILSTPLEAEGEYVEVPLESFPRLDQGGVVLSRAADIDAARVLRDYLVGPEGVAILESYGFFLPGT